MVSVIIPCWNIDSTLNNLTQICVQSIRDTSDVELILVDNGSTHGRDYMSDEADIYIRNQTNQGYVKAINQGFKLSSGDWVVFGNSDFKMSKGWVEGLQTLFDNNPTCGVVCPAVKGGMTIEDMPWEEQGTMGGWFMMRRSDFLRVGLWDERFFNLFGDFDYKYRLHRAGLLVFSTPYVVVEHYGSASISKFSGNKADHAKGKQLFLDKWKDDPEFEAFLKKNYGVTQALK